MARIVAVVLILWVCSPETLLGRVVLETGEIDSNKVKMMDRLKETTDTLSTKENVRERIVKKLGGGVLVGGLSILAGGAVGEIIAQATCDNPDAYYDGYVGCEGDGLIPGALVGYVIGVPIGIHWVDLHDRFIYSFAGSMIGGVASVLMSYNNEELWPSLIIGPLVGATIMSEFSRKLPKDSRFSIGLAPAPNGRVSAVATLRF